MQHATRNNNLIRPAEYARLRGLNRSTISRQIGDGIIPVHNGLLEPAEADLAREKNLDVGKRRRTAAVHPAQRAEPSTDPDGLPMTGSTREIFNRARAAREIAMANERQLELRKRQGELLEASEVELAWTQALTSFKNRLLSLPDKLAPKMAACSSVLECRAMIDQEIRKVLIALSKTKADAS
jgi:hypothetical protein